MYAIVPYKCHSCKKGGTFPVEDGKAHHLIITSIIHDAVVNKKLHGNDASYLLLLFCLKIL